MYVGMGEMKVSLFDTKNDFEYVRTITLDESVNSITAVSNGFLTSGSPIFGTQPDESLFKNLSALTKWSGEGEKQQTFGETYPIVGKFMLARDMISQSIVRMIPKQEEVFLVFQNFPLLYRYNLNEELLKTYKIKNFKLPQIQYDKTEHSVSVPLDDFSRISNLWFLDNNHLLIYVKTFIRGEHGGDNRDKENIMPLTNTFHSFYVLNVDDNSSYFLGGLDGDDTRFQITKNHIYKISEGRVFKLIDD